MIDHEWLNWRFNFWTFYFHTRLSRPSSKFSFRPEVIKIEMKLTNYYTLNLQSVIRENLQPLHHHLFSFKNGSNRYLLRRFFSFSFHLYYWPIHSLSLDKIFLTYVSHIGHGSGTLHFQTTQVFVTPFTPTCVTRFPSIVLYSIFSDRLFLYSLPIYYTSENPVSFLTPKRRFVLHFDLYSTKYYVIFTLLSSYLSS